MREGEEPFFFSSAHRERARRLPRWAALFSRPFLPASAPTKSESSLSSLSSFRRMSELSLCRRAGRTSSRPSLRRFTQLYTGKRSRLHLRPIGRHLLLKESLHEVTDLRSHRATGDRVTIHGESSSRHGDSHASEQCEAGSFHGEAGLGFRVCRLSARGGRLAASGSGLCWIDLRSRRA